MMEIAAEVNGVYLHMDDAFGAQCWDSQAYINSHYFGLPVIDTGGEGRWPGWAGNMVDAFPQSPEVAAAYELVAPNEPVLPGDTLVWDQSNSAWYPATHVATAVKDVGNGWILCLSQNSSAPRPDLPGYSSEASGPTILQHLPKEGLLGIIRPRTGINYQGTTNEPEEDVPNTALELEQATLNVLTQNKTVMGDRTLVQGVNQALLGIDVVNSNIDQLKAFIAQRVAPEAGVKSESEGTFYFKGDKKPEVYALDAATGKVRHVEHAEFDVVRAINLYKEVEQAKVDALLKASA
jgi:hypothetical protein